MRRKTLVVGLLITLLASGVGSVAAQSTPDPIEEDAPIYENETGTTNMTGWVPNDGNTTADGMLDMIARIPTIFVGTGGLDPAAVGYEGVLLTGLIIGAATLMAMVGTGAGPIGGSMIGIVLAYGLTILGIIPAWIQPLLLFTLAGVPASMAILRVFNR